MKILADFHHQALYYSLQLLFENRLGHQLFRPIGLDWWNEGYWEVYPHPHTANQFLGLDQATSLPLDVHGNPLPEEERKNLHCLSQGDGIYFTKDVINGGFQKGITLAAFKETKFDILISSIPQHIDRYNRLIQLYQPQAKHIFQVGNAWGQLPGVRNIMASTAPFGVSSGINTVFYHQEFDLNVFSYEPPRFHNTVNSYIHYMRQPELMDRFKFHFPGWKFTKYGAGMELSLNGTRAVAEALKDSGWTYHYKPEGDGFGHVCFSSAACGRPPIIHKSFYRGKLAEQLMIDRQTCIDTSNRPFEEVVRLLSFYSRPEEHQKICENTYSRFKEVVNFNQDAERVKGFLERLQ